MNAQGWRRLREGHLPPARTRILAAVFGPLVAAVLIVFITGAAHKLAALAGSHAPSNEREALIATIIVGVGVLVMAASWLQRGWLLQATLYMGAALVAFGAFLDPAAVPTLVVLAMVAALLIVASDAAVEFRAPMSLVAVFMFQTWLGMAHVDGGLGNLGLSILAMVYVYLTLREPQGIPRTVLALLGFGACLAVAGISFVLAARSYQDGRLVLLAAAGALTAFFAQALWGKNAKNWRAPALLKLPRGAPARHASDGPNGSPPPKTT